MADDRLRGLLQRDSILLVPAAFDMVSAKIIEKVGFEAVYLSGFGQSASHLGLPDAGLMTFTEMVERVHNMARAINPPLLADGNTGYGGIVNVRRTVGSRGPLFMTCPGSVYPRIFSRSCAARMMASRSMPVSTPMSSSIKTTSSVGRLPAAWGT